MRNFMICSAHQMLRWSYDHMKDYEMDGTCGMHGEERKWI
jgi:hypothetical protein